MLLSMENLLHRMDVDFNVAIDTVYFTCFKLFCNFAPSEMLLSSRKFLWFVRVLYAFTSIDWNTCCIANSNWGSNCGHFCLLVLSKCVVLS